MLVLKSDAIDELRISTLSLNSFIILDVFLQQVRARI